MITIILCAWAVLLVLFVIGNKRWHDRMERMDADMEAAFAVDCAERGVALVKGN